MAIDPVTKNYITPVKPAVTPQPAAKPVVSPAPATTTVKTPAATYTNSSGGTQQSAPTPAPAPAKTEAGAVHKIAKSDAEIRENIASVKANARPLEIGGKKGAAGNSAPAVSGAPAQAAAAVSGNTASAVSAQSGAAASATAAKPYGDKNPVNKQEIMEAATALRKTFKTDMKNAVTGAGLGLGTQYKGAAIPKAITRQTMAPENSPAIVDVTG